ncbi:MAG TPA: Gfo/Idh/MocA family oxidoreductase, partial [Clostridia bacterium]|nr:Gfo/Idh/MocA family oxidoreductase [Clostridia bacterium]
AVGSRSKERAEAFAQKFGILSAYGSYEEVVNDPEVDIVYIATPHPAHKEGALMSLKAGKAVLCEKPFTVNASDTEEVIGIAREKKLFLMEAMWTRFLPSRVKAREWIKKGAIGEILMFKGDFGFRTVYEPEGRLLNPNLAGGALLDVGIYPISFASMLFGTQPSEILSMAHIGSTNVDEQFAAIFRYSEGRMASITAAVRAELGNDAEIIGTEGKIRIPHCWWADSAALIVGEKVEIYESPYMVNGYEYEAIEAVNCLNEGKLESEVMPLDESLEIMKTLDKMRGQWGLKYPFEK